MNFRALLIVLPILAFVACKKESPKPETVPKDNGKLVKAIIAQTGADRIVDSFFYDDLKRLIRYTHGANYNFNNYEIKIAHKPNRRNIEQFDNGEYQKDYSVYEYYNGNGIIDSAIRGPYMENIGGGPYFLVRHYTSIGNDAIVSDTKMRGANGYYYEYRQFDTSTYSNGNITSHSYREQRQNWQGEEEEEIHNTTYEYYSNYNNYMPLVPDLVYKHKNKNLVKKITEERKYIHLAYNSIPYLVTLEYEYVFDADGNVFIIYEYKTDSNVTREKTTYKVLYY